MCALSISSCEVLRPHRLTPQAVYTVEAGDTLSGVADRFGVTLRKLQAANGFGDLTRIYPGEKIRLPKDYISSSRMKSSSASKMTALLGPAQSYVGSLDWPLIGSRSTAKRKVNSGFGKRWSSFHEGIDIDGNIGTPIIAAHSGRVVYSGNRMNGYGNMVVIEGEGLMTAYAHNRRNIVRVGTNVKQGDRIAELGRTGRVTGPHLHFETRIRNSRGRFVAVDPMLFYSGFTDSALMSSPVGRGRYDNLPSVER